MIQIIKFIVVGVGATAVDFVVSNIAKFIFQLPNNWAVTIGFIVALVFNYILSKIWVFEFDKKQSTQRQFILFVVLSVIGFLLNLLIFDFSAVILAFIAQEGFKFNLAKVIATTFVMVYNFISRKIFLERKTI